MQKTTIAWIGAILLLMHGGSALAEARTPAAVNQEAAYIDALDRVIKTGPYEAYRKQIQDLFNNSQFSALDQYFNVLQHAYETGKIDDRTLYYAYMPLDLKDSRYAPLFSAWAQSSPESYPAAYALATYKISLAWNARGKRWASKTSKSQLDSFAALLQSAMAENERSLALTGKPILALANKLRILRAGGSLGLARSDSLKIARATLDQARTIDPGNSLARANYMVILQPRWGGSYKEMQEFVAAEKAGGVPPQVATYLDSLIPADMGDMLYRQEKYAEALPYLHQAAALQTHYYDYGNVESLKLYIYSIYKNSWQTNKSDPDSKEFLSLLDLLLREGRYVPGSGWFYGERAQTKWNVNRDAEGAWADYNQGAARNDAHSLYNVARIYCHGDPSIQVAKDKKKCAHYMTQAAKHGSEPAKKELPNLP